MSLRTRYFLVQAQVIVLCLFGAAIGAMHSLWLSVVGFLAGAFCAGMAALGEYARYLRESEGSR